MMCETKSCLIGVNFPNGGLENEKWQLWDIEKESARQQRHLAPRRCRRLLTRQYFVQINLFDGHVIILIGLARHLESVASLC